MMQTPVVIQHPPFERLILHAVGVVTFVMMSVTLPQTLATVDEKAAALLALLVPGVVWFASDFRITRSPGLIERFEWSARSNRLSLIVAQQWKTLLSARFTIADDYGNETVVNIME